MIVRTSVSATVQRSVRTTVRTTVRTIVQSRPNERPTTVSVSVRSACSLRRRQRLHGGNSARCRRGSGSQTPSWERKQVPAWERPQVPAWETKNPARTLLDQARDERRLAKTPRPRHNRPAGRVRAAAVSLLRRRGRRYGYGVSSSTTYVTPPPPQRSSPAPPPVVETGFLRLEVEPRQELQIFVDGLYIGTLADLGEEIELRLGARRIELRAPGYRTLVFDTEIVPDRTIVYRGALEPIATAPRHLRHPDAPRAPAGTRSAPEAPASNPIYLIPGCYMGTCCRRPRCCVPAATSASSRRFRASWQRRFNFRNAASISA